MNICLVRPQFPEEQTTVYPPLGLLTIAPYFDKKHSVSLADQQLYGCGGFLSNEYDVIAFSAFTSQLPIVNKLIDQGKEWGVKAKFVVGGPAVTSNPEYAKQLVPNADLLFAGDGEYLAESIEAISNKTGIADYREFPYGLDNKKYPNWSLTKPNLFRETTGLGVETSRGCCFNCLFCTAHLIHGKKWIPRKPSEVVEELKFLKQRYGCSKFYFADDNATVDPSRWFELMRDISVSYLGLTLSVPEGIQAHNLDYETLVEMWMAGLRRFTIGAESGVQRVLTKAV